MATTTSDTDSSQYREVRGLSRGLAVLRALNALPGGIGGVVELARATGLHRTTVKRLLETLRMEGLVHHKDVGASYALGFEVRDRVPSRGVTPQPGQAEMHAVLSAALQATEPEQYR